jgi:Spy/CpxP family protein refolding chaperone
MYMRSLLLVVGCTISSSLFAQIPRTIEPETPVKQEVQAGEESGVEEALLGGGMGNQRMSKEDRRALMKSLNLSREQARKLKEIRQQNKPQLEAIRNDASLQPADRRAKMRDLMQQQQDQLSAILSPEQQQRMKTFRREQMEKRKNDPNRPRRGVTNMPNERNNG